MYESIKAWTCKLGRIEKLYAFSYVPPPLAAGPSGGPERKEKSWWGIYDPLKEWRRMGVGLGEGSTGAPGGEKGKAGGEKVISGGRNWRISNINVDYSVCFPYGAALYMCW